MPKTGLNVANFEVLEVVGDFPNLEYVSCA